jgi:outer membrane protein assembly factor BamE (lipoprotein component of BamABCDE complex)
MKSKNTLLTTAFLMIICFSCSNKKFFVAPEFTNVQKISTLSKGMTVSQVNVALGVMPYDAIFDLDNLLLSYNYRLRKRRIPVTNLNSFVNMYEDPAKNSVNSEAAQTTGSIYYDEWKKLYVKFNEGKLTEFFSDEGLENASRIAIVENRIALLESSIKQSKNNGNVIVVNDDLPGNYYFVDSLGQYHVNPSTDSRFNITTNSKTIQRLNLGEGNSTNGNSQNWNINQDYKGLKGMFKDTNQK